MKGILRKKRLILSLVLGLTIIIFGQVLLRSSSNKVSNKVSKQEKARNGCESGAIVFCGVHGLFDPGYTKEELNKVYRDGCQKGWGAYCKEMSELVKGEERTRLLKKGCQLDNPTACEHYAGVLFKQGQTKKAAQILEDMCRENKEKAFGPCSSLITFEQEVGKEKELDAKVLSCKYASYSCEDVAYARIEKGRFKEAASFLNMGCDVQDPKKYETCSDLASYYYVRGAKLSARAPYKHDCLYGDGSSENSCVSYATLLGKRSKEAEKFLKLACERNQNRCQVLEEYQKGKLPTSVYVGFALSAAFEKGKTR